MNGLLIDCARLVERREYYYKLIGFMAEWGMDALLLHFTDDHGCAVKLPGFESLALPNAFSAEETRNLVAFAASRGVEVIPELETFGHTRFLTDRPEYERLYAGKKEAAGLSFNAIDPLAPESLALMGSLMDAVAKVFSSKTLHVGCDEVDLKGYCQERSLDPDEVWTSYVNRILALAKSKGFKPMFWGDHPTASGKIAKLLDKESVVVDWRYHAGVEIDAAEKLNSFGFAGMVQAPSIACWPHLCFPSAQQFENVKRMSFFAKRLSTLGTICTVWCPYRYYQDALWPAIAFSAEAARLGGEIELESFAAEFSRKFFGEGSSGSFQAFFSSWIEGGFTLDFGGKMLKRDWSLKEKERETLRASAAKAEAALEAAKSFVPERNAGAFSAMRLSAESSLVCSKYLLLRSAGEGEEALKSCLAMKDRVLRESLETWGKTRFSEDAFQCSFPGGAEEANHLMLVLQAAN